MDKHHGAIALILNPVDFGKDIWHFVIIIFLGLMDRTEHVQNAQFAAEFLDLVYEPVHVLRICDFKIGGMTAGIYAHPSPETISVCRSTTQQPRDAALRNSWRVFPAD